MVKVYIKKTYPYAFCTSLSTNNRFKMQLETRFSSYKILIDYYYYNWHNNRALLKTSWHLGKSKKPKVVTQLENKWFLNKVNSKLENVYDQSM